MSFKITIPEEAERQFRSLAVRQQRILEAAILSRLASSPQRQRKRSNAFVKS